MAKIKTGCDLVSLKRFEQAILSGTHIMLDKIFSVHELAKNPGTETLAGIFAAKEAMIKALELPAGHWRDMEIVKEKSGRPLLQFVRQPENLADWDISISHDGEYAMAVAVCTLTRYYGAH